MDARAQAQEILAEFARSIELENLSLDENDSCRLGFDDELFVDIDYDAAEQRLVMSANVGSPPVASAADIHEAALRNNALWQDRVATVAIDGTTGQLMLLRSVPVAQLDAQALTVALENFVRAARGWRILVTQGEVQPEKASNAPDRSHDGSAIRV